MPDQPEYLQHEMDERADAEDDRVRKYLENGKIDGGLCGMQAYVMSNLDGGNRIEIYVKGDADKHIAELEADKATHLERTAKIASNVVRACAERDAATADRDNWKSLAGKLEAQLTAAKELEAAVKRHFTDPHQRRCHPCGEVFIALQDYNFSTASFYFVNCPKCGSQDTRRIKAKEQTNE